MVDNYNKNIFIMIVEEHIRNCVAEDELQISEDEIKEYVDTISRASFEDPGFIETLEEDGPVDTWENDWITEFIQEHSNFYERYYDL